LKAAQHAYWDYDAIDVNMGCPMKFSTHGGMGSALLKQPEKVKDILSTLVCNIDKPVTCKIRLRDNMDDTIALVKLIESTGVKALAVHGRYIDQRPEKKAHMDLLPIVKSAVSIPMIANGDVFKYEDIEKVKQITTCSSVLIARGALWNCSVFQPNPIPAIDVALDLFDKFIYWDNSWSYSKYVFQRMFVDVSAVLFDKINMAKTFPELKNVLLEFKEETSKDQPAKSNE
jgi:tRNA-dihydrouridine synthase 2